MIVYTPQAYPFGNGAEYQGCFGGRHPRSKWRLQSLQASRVYFHVTVPKVLKDGEKPYVEFTDLGSTNPSYVDGNKLEALLPVPFILGESTLDAVGTRYVSTKNPADGSWWFHESTSRPGFEFHGNADHGNGQSSASLSLPASGVFPAPGDPNPDVNITVPEAGLVSGQPASSPAGLRAGLRRLFHLQGGDQKVDLIVQDLNDPLPGQRPKTDAPKANEPGPDDPVKP